MFWYDEDIKRLERERVSRSNNEGVVFYGSSSIRMWDSLAADFEGYNPINAGFGGSTLAACVWFFNKTVAPLRPTSMVIYAGDNDLGDGRHPEEVFIYFRQLMAQIHYNFGDIPVAYLSIKPSISRWSIVEQIKFTNKIISQEIKKMHCNIRYVDVFTHMIDEMGFPKREYFMPDGLHITKAGYQLWKERIYQEVQHKHFKFR